MALQLYANTKKKDFANTILGNMPILRVTVEFSSGQMFDEDSTIGVIYKCVSGL